jgi:uncharacterized protein YwlG (UPF0340 family)
MSVEDVVPLVPSEIVEEEQVEAGEDIGETSKGNANKIEIDLEIIILMIEDHENVVPIAPLSEQKNANEDVELHAHIDGGDIAIELHLLQLLSQPSSQMERMGGVFFCQICHCNIFLDCGP